MAKRCITCDEMAEFCVKGSSECYCTPCATELFGDVTYLISVEEAAKTLKDAIEDQISELGLDKEQEEQ